MTAIRSAALSDAARLAEIYRYYVENTAISFEYDAPTEEEFRERIKRTLGKYPYLVLEEDGAVQGYTYAGPFAEREAYGWCCELSIYIDKGSRRRGIGRKLYEAIEEELKKMGFLNLYARIAWPEKEDEYLTGDSVEFHRRLGFTEAGRFNNCGYKFGRWYGMVCMEKTVGEHLARQKPVARHWPVLTVTGDVPHEQGGEL